jgi:hypothetical protein
VARIAADQVFALGEIVGAVIMESLPGLLVAHLLPSQGGRYWRKEWLRFDGFGFSCAHRLVC